MLSQEQTSELRQVLEQRRGELIREIREDLARVRGDTFREVAGPAGDPGDQSVFDLISDLNQADARRDVSELREIEAARNRVDEGTYGECMDCGQDIGFSRLKANPAALRCILCQTRFEKTHAGGAPGRSTL
ncbi:MAG TPA: TraR/DksA family transcriptional regulator [Burkholderiales bacterium]|nr:TraR/DksA family transcriptional regulator [Burkholderiales bacterium]